MAVAPAPISGDGPPSPFRGEGGPSRVRRPIPAPPGSRRGSRSTAWTQCAARSRSFPFRKPRSGSPGLGHLPRSSGRRW